MASSANAENNVSSGHATGTFTSAASAAAETITIGWDPEVFVALCNNNGTNPDVVISFNGGTDSLFITGSTGVITSPTNQVTYNGDGTVALSATPQTNSGVNYWIAWRQ